MLWTTRVLKALQELVQLCRDILKILKLRQPGFVWIKVTESFYKEHIKMLKFKLVLPSPGASDVVSRKITVKIGEQDVLDAELAGDALETAEMSGVDNDPVVGSLVDVDDAGNMSPAREFSFVLIDSIAPPQPGELGIVVTGEE
jgi:hypothetical protein